MTEWPGNPGMWSLRITIDLSKVSGGDKLAQVQTILRYYMPIYDWIYENGTKEFGPYHRYFTLILLLF